MAIQASPGSMRICTGRGQRLPSGVVSEESSQNSSRMVSGRYRIPERLGAVSFSLGQPGPSGPWRQRMAGRRPLRPDPDDRSRHMDGADLGRLCARGGRADRRPRLRRQSGSGAIRAKAALSAEQSFGVTTPWSASRSKGTPAYARVSLAYTQGR